MSNLAQLLIESITWIPVTERIPDSDLTVLLCDPEGDEPVWLGYLDGEEDEWLYVDGATANPKYWAEIPRGPGA